MHNQAPSGTQLCNCLYANAMGRTQRDYRSRKNEV